MTQKDLDKIIKNHQHWLRKDCKVWKNLRANLREANLRGVNLSEVNLSGADLYRADLSGADLYRTDLSGANLCEADLREADLREADLREANLRGVNLSEVNLSGADLYRADLCDANLCGVGLYRANLREAYLCGTNLYEADLREANLRGTDLCDANLRGTNLRGAKHIPFIPLACPDTGSFIAYKKANNRIVKLLIPEDANRLSATTRKCRCNKAEVLEIQNLNGSLSELVSVHSDRDRKFIYTVGETVKVDDFDENRWNECSTGIHFFINRKEAVEY